MGAAVRGAAGHDEAWEEIWRTGLLGAWPVQCLPEAGSTNDVALRLAGEGAASGTIVLAERQIDGRGRMGRRWVSPPGAGLAVSVLLRPALDPSDLPKVTLVAGLAVCLAVEEETGLSPRLKWPNDLLLAGKKCGGILVETSGLGQHSPAVVVGIGVNVNPETSAFPEEIQARVTSLADHAGRALARGTILAAIVRRLHETVARLEQGGFAGLLEEWKERDGLQGCQLSWLTPAGAVVRGVSLGPDGDGFLHVRDAQGKTHRVISGDITRSWEPGAGE